jgi:myosin-18
MKAQIRDFENRVRDQEEELDELTSTVQQLEQNKVRLEMQAEKEKQKWTREIAEKESEMDDLRFHTQKKIKAIEMQLEEESEISSALQREKRDLERKLREINSNQSLSKQRLGSVGHHLGDFNGHAAAYAEYLNKLKRQMLKYKTLAIDAQIQLEKIKDNSAKTSIMRSLKAQLEDSEISKANALKQKQLLQMELNDLQQQLEESNLQRQNLDEINMHLNREVNNFKSQLEEQERDSDEILKKYQNHIQNYSLDSHRFIDLNNQIDILNIENRICQEKIREHEEKCAYYESSWVDKSEVAKVESKIRDLECKLDLETTHKTRFQNQLERVKQQCEKAASEIEHISSREKKCEDSLKRSQRQVKDTCEELGDLKKKVIDLEETRKRLEQQNEILERELDSSKGENKINQNRLEAFQNAFNTMNNENEDQDDEDDDLDDDLEESDDMMDNNLNGIDDLDEDYGDDLENSSNRESSI